MLALDMNTFTFKPIYPGSRFNTVWSATGLINRASNTASCSW